MTGNIIANAGFIAVYGTTVAGKTAIDANVLAVWGGIQSLGQGSGMITMHLHVVPRAFTRAALTRQCCGQVRSKDCFLHYLGRPSRRESLVT